MLPVATSTTRSFGKPADTITLDETARHRRRMAMRSDGGIEFLLDLPHASLLAHGDGLLLDDGRVIEVRAAPEPLYEVRGRDARHLLALAWQLGNRHLPAEIAEDRILIRRDHVIRDMLKGLGATVAEITAPFSPEGGAYHTHAHGHDHSHAHGHGHHHHD
ncbi:urease accessory protein UreE [Chelativorans sp.]|uniref:urease accessory protein UreE n=1 Tax=Chelativorans sp. TaxID=2203393 RepID=UPI0028127F22|nr:urease accessory protein UreE [Chelativorans sp.]